MRYQHVWAFTTPRTRKKPSSDILKIFIRHKTVATKEIRKNRNRKGNSKNAENNVTTTQLDLYQQTRKSKLQISQRF